ncbi:MAG: CdaR family protein [Myxococcota bacterium]
MSEPDPTELLAFRSPGRVLWASLVANPWAKLLSIAIALSTWLYVQGEEVREDRVKAQIAWMLPSDLVATEALPTTAYVTVRGTRSAVNKAHQSPVRLVIDAQELAKGDHEVDLGGVLPEGLPPSVVRLTTSPSVVQFTLDRVATRSVRIEPVLVGEPASGYTVVEVDTDPAVLEVRGPREAVSSLREVPTRPIDVSGLEEDAEREVVLDLPRGVEPSSSAPITATLKVESRTEQRRIEAVPVFVWGPGAASEAWRLTPDRVAVVLEGPTDTLGDLRSDQVAAFVHLPEAPDRAQVEAWYGPKSGVRVEVLQPGGPAVQVLSIDPPSVIAVAP